MNSVKNKFKDMKDKRKVKEIVKAIATQKKRVANNLSKKIEKKEHLFSILIPLFAGVLFEYIEDSCR